MRSIKFNVKYIAQNNIRKLVTINIEEPPAKR